MLSESECLKCSFITGKSDKHTDTNKIPQCKIPNASFLAGNLLGALSGNGSSSVPRVFRLFASWEETPAFIVPAVSHKDSTFQVIQASLLRCLWKRSVKFSRHQYWSVSGYQALLISLGTRTWSPASACGLHPQLKGTSGTHGAAGRQ